MRGDEHAPFAGWTPELIEASCAQYDAEQAELMQHMNYAYAEGRKDEAEEWKERILPLLRELHASEYLSEQQCAALLGCDLLGWRFSEDNA